MYERVPVTDGLAAERTVLAAERTFLAYVRTGFALFVAGLSGAHLLQDVVLVSVGYVLVALSVPVLGVGVWRLAQSKRMIRRMLARLAPPGGPRNQ